VDFAGKQDFVGAKGTGIPSSFKLSKNAQTAGGI